MLPLYYLAWKEFDVRPSRSLARIFSIVAAGAMVATLSVAAHAAPFAEQSVLQCAASVPVYRVTADGQLYRYSHQEPESGIYSWTGGPPSVGQGWQTGRPVAAPDGVFYAPWNTGELRRYRWVNNAWETYNGSGYQVAHATGWERYVNDAAYRNLITADAEGHLYMVQPDGNLHWRAHDAVAGTWRHRVIADGWNQYNLIFAAGKGIIYGRLPNGDLHRHRYHAASNRWIGPARTVGVGFWQFDRVLSPGGDILYAIKPNGDMLWYRWNEDTETWAASNGQLVGNGWNDTTTTAQPDGCQRVGTSMPTRPAVPAQPNGAVSLLGTSDGHAHYSYVDSQGRAVYAEATDFSGATPTGLAVVPGFQGVTGTTATGEYQDGQVVLLATGTDADTRESVRGTNNTWTTPTNEGGFLVTPPAVTRVTGNVLASFALDSSANLWTRRQTAANTPLDGWRQAGPTPLALQRLAVTSTSTGVRLIGLGSNGVLQTATFENNTLSTWTSLGGTGFTGTASPVTLPDGTLQVFATDNTGTVRTQRQTTTGFPGTWTTIGTITAAGNPSAIMAPDGTLQVLVKSTDGYAYYASQPAPGATTFNPWRTVTTSEETTTDPTALAMPSANTWVVGYLNDNGVPKLRRYQPPTPARAATPTFIDLPLRGDV